MPATTPNLGLTKDYEGEPYSLTRVNANSDRIDTFAGETNTALAAKQGALTSAQMDAVNSGITAAKLTADEAALAEVVDSGAKNAIIFDGVGTGTSNVGTSYTSNGITFEVQSDETIRVTGTIASGNSYCYLYAGTSRINIVDFFDGNHVLSGNPQGASISTYRLWYKVGSQTAVSVGDPSVILPAITGETNAVLGLQVDAPQTNLDITFKPMICTKAAWDVSHKYVLYLPSWQKMYEMILALKGYHAINTISSSSQSPADIDDYKDTGFFIVTSASVAATIAHAPFTAAGFVLEITPSYQVLGSVRGAIQTATSYISGSTTIKKRWYLYSNSAWSWTEWETIGTGTRSALMAAAPDETKNGEAGEER